jgi:predicted  nucleic acid-binding Zn-ribbon protein
LAKIDILLSSFTKKANKLQSKINAMPEMQELKSINSEIKRLKQYAKKVAESIETTLTDDLYDVSGETLYDKISNLKKGVK